MPKEKKRRVKVDDEENGFLYQEFYKSIEEKQLEPLARTRSMNQEGGLIGHALVATKLGISLRIVRKRRKRTRMTKKALPRKKDQDTRNKPVKLTLVKNGIL